MRWISVTGTLIRWCAVSAFVLASVASAWPHARAQEGPESRAASRDFSAADIAAAQQFGQSTSSEDFSITIEDLNKAIGYEEQS